MTCPSCGLAVAEGSRFCGNCGHQVAARDDEQRRVVTVLFADLVGFTSLSEGRDPEQVKRVVDGCFEELVAVVEAFGGRVDKIIGDAILALFGAPVGHEDDAERAVRAALRMQETLQQRDAAAGLRLRIGVNTGEVLVGALRSGGDYTAMGDVVNTAQRLQTAAEPGQVLVGPSTREAAGARISYKELGPQQVRGRDEPIEAWLVLDTLEPPGRRSSRVAGPLVGRASEMAVLTGEIDLAVRNRRAQSMLIVGDAGVGKSRLAGELVQYARERHGAWVLEGHCVPYGEANVWWPVAEALRQATGLAADAPDAEARRAVTDLASGLRSRPPDDPEVERIADGILELLGYESGLRDIEAGRARDEAMQALIDLTAAAAADRPVVVLLHDVHWADDVVLDTIDHLTPRIGRNPYVVIGTARPSIHEQWNPSTGRHNSTVLHLDPLEHEASESLLDLLLAEDVGDDVRAEVLDRSAGNPFFIEELVALLDETGTTQGAPALAETDGDVAELSGLPDSLRGLVVARLDALDDQERAVVEDAAVLGRSGPVEGLEIMGAHRRGAQGVSEIVDSLVDKEILRVDGDRWSFRSDLVRDVAYGTMTKTLRAVSHAGVATWYDEHFGGPDARDSVIDRMAHHYGTAAALVADMGEVDGVPDDVRRRALHWIGDASARALESEHYLVGARLFGQALLLLEDDAGPDRWEALLGRSRCRANLRQIDGAREDAQRVLTEAEEAEDEVMVGRALTALGDAQQKEGDGAAARATFTRAIGHLAEAGADRERGVALRLRGMAELFGGETELAEASISAALDVARTVGDRKGEAWALQNLAWLAFEGGRAQEAEQWIDQSVEAFREIGDHGGLGWALGLSAWVKMHVGQRDEAARIAADVLPQARARGDLWAEAMMQMLISSVHLWSGRAAQSLSPAAEAEGCFVRAEDPAGITQARITQGRALLMLGRVDEGWPFLVGDLPGEGRALTQAAGDRTRLIGVSLGATAIGEPVRAVEMVDRYDADRIDLEAIGGVDLLAGFALLRLQLGDVAAAGALVERFLAPDEVPAPALAAVAALVEVARGRFDEARRLAESVPGAERSTFADRVLASVSLGLLEAARGSQQASAARFAAAREELRSTDDRLDRAVVALIEADALAALGADPDERRAESDRLWAEMGADPVGWRTVARLALDVSAPEGV